MPKEITHWLIAMKMAQGLGGNIGKTVTAFPNTLKLGAIFPDVLYYCVGDGEKTPYRDLAHRYHGNSGGDSYETIRQIARAIPHTPYPGQLTAFLAGVVCHIRTDATFHPLVYYLTGNYEDADPRQRSVAVEGHRRLECLIDLYFCGGRGNLARYSLKDCVKKLEMPLDHLFGLLSPQDDAGRRQGFVSAAQASLNIFTIMQRLSGNGFLAGLLDRFAAHLPRTAREIGALLYSPALDAALPGISGTLAFKNPVTGIPEETTLDGLFTLAVERSTALLREIEAALQNPGTIFLPEKGPSLSYGLAGNPEVRPRFFAAEPFPGIRR